MATENGEVKGPGLQPVSVELPEDPLQSVSETPPPPNASGKTAEAGGVGDHSSSEPAGGGAGASPRREGAGGGESASLSDVVVGILSQPRIIADGVLNTGE